MLAMRRIGSGGPAAGSRAPEAAAGRHAAIALGATAGASRDPRCHRRQRGGRGGGGERNRPAHHQRPAQPGNAQGTRDLCRQPGGGETFGPSDAPSGHSLVSSTGCINSVPDIPLPCSHIAIATSLTPLFPQGVIGMAEVRELFNAALANFCPNPVTEPPVMEIKMDSTGAQAILCGMEQSHF